MNITEKRLNEIDAFASKRGVKLLLAERYDDDSAVVICKLPDNRATPFVCWIYTYDAPGRFSPAFFWGHYGKAIDDLWEVYNERRTRYAKPIRTMSDPDDPRSNYGAADYGDLTDDD